MPTLNLYYSSVLDYSPGFAVLLSLFPLLAFASSRLDCFWLALEEGLVESPKEQQQRNCHAR